MYRIGCDVGGTNTDAAILDVAHLTDASRGVLATCKTSTTINVTDGIKLALQDVLVKSGVDPERVENVAVGTTHFVNAVIENDARHLNRVACVRLCGPYTRETPPFSDYPWALRDLVEGPVYYLDGGLEIDGREITPLDVDQIQQTTRSIIHAGITAVAIVGVFSALDHENLHEERCKELMLEICPELSITCSHVVGGPGLLVRENATILNASILSFAQRTIIGFQQAALDLGLKCPLFLTQNDGTLIEASMAADIPVKTFASGPTNSLMGAAFLHGLVDRAEMANKQILVVDIGGTTTDICALLPSGFPRKAPNFVEVGGVRTAFSMPDVYSIGLGGGSRVRFQDNGCITVGPDSVAHRLTSEALVFGGTTMTTTDIVVASGTTHIGDKEQVAALPQNIISAARSEIRSILIRAMDHMKVSNAPIVALLVGGGSIIVGNELDAVVHCVRPPHHDSANAIGAAIAKVAGDVDTIEVVGNQDEELILKKMKQSAIDAAISAGADPEDTRVVDITKVPLQYVTNKATRYIIKAVGSLNPGINNAKVSNTGNVVYSEPKNTVQLQSHHQQTHVQPRSGSLATPALQVDLATYRPTIRNNIWQTTSVDVELISVGCGILGTGGGGSPYSESLYIFSLLEKNPEKPIHIVSPFSLLDTDICVSGSGFGAPSVSSERVDSGTHIFTAIEQVNKILSISDFQSVIAAEIGGGNGIVAFPTAAYYGRPVVDADFMGRAYPTIEHCTPYLYGEPILPAAIADTKGNVAVVIAAENSTKVEGMLRTTCVELGNHVGVAVRPLTGDVVKKYAVPNTLSQAWFLGRAVRIAQRTKIEFIAALQEVMPVRLIYAGKIVDVQRDVSKGYTVGKCVIAPLSAEDRDAGDTDAQISGETRNLILPFQNEYLAAYLVESGTREENKNFICTVPDLISVLGQDGEAIGSPELRYGLQVKVIAMPAHPLWTTEAGLRVGGPDFFQLGTPWVSIGEYRQPKSVFEEYGDA